PVQLSTPARRIDWGGVILIETPKGAIRARSAIITASTAALRAIAFTPELPKSHADAIAALSLGQQEQVVLEIDGNPLDLDPDDLVFEKANGKRTAALLANIGGSNLSVVSVGGAFAGELAQASDDALKEFAIEWVSATFGSSIKAKVVRSGVSAWGKNPLVGGAFSIAPPGRADAHRILMSPLRDRVWFAGDAAHETLWGTVNGAWESGTRAAEGALRLIGALPSETKEKPTRESRPKRRRRRRDD